MSRALRMTLGILRDLESLHGLAGLKLEDTQFGPMVDTEATTTAYAPELGKEGQHGDGDGSTTVLVLDSLLSFWCA